MESQRQKKIASVLTEDLFKVFSQFLKTEGLNGVLISVTKVYVASDLSLAKVYLSVFPPEKSLVLLESIKKNDSKIKHQIAIKTRHQFRKMPELKFYTDDSLEYIDSIDRSLKEIDNPIKNRNLLVRRKKL